MELYFLNKSFTVTSDPIDEFTSAVWSEKYYETGSFTVHLPKKFANTARDAAYMRTEFDENGDCFCGRIETVSVSSGDESDCTVSGILLEGLLGDRVTYTSGEISGEVISSALSVVSDNLRDLPITIDYDNSSKLEQSSVLTWKWDKLSDWLYSVLRPYGASYTIKLRLGDTTPKLRIVSGSDKSSSVVFSTSFGNILSLEYEKVGGKLRNFAYCEGGDGTIAVLRKYATDRRETYLSAKEISPDKYTDDDEYRSALTQKAEETLAKYPISVTLSVETSPDIPPYYGEDYKLGDICQISDSSIRINTPLRLTSVDTVCESGKTRVYPFFGESLRWRDLI